MSNRLFVVSIVLFFIYSCEPKKEVSKINANEIKGDLVVFHSGSLTKPLQTIFKEFVKRYPKVNIKAEGAGSRDGVRKIIDLQRPCDIFISDDYQIVEQLLIPNYANWDIPFASNEMVIAYNSKSKFANEISAQTWTKILLDETVKFGRTNPDIDPCGYRAIFMMKLAQIKYNLSNEFYDNILFKDLDNIRPLEADLIALLNKNRLDYIFIYKSVAKQNHLKFIELPDEINLRNPQFNSFYGQASTKLSGKFPGEFMEHIGESIIYSISIPKSSVNINTAMAFAKFFLSKENGQRILETNFQKSIVPAPSTTFGSIPSILKPFTKSAVKTVVFDTI